MSNESKPTPLADLSPEAQAAIMRQLERYQAEEAKQRRIVEVLIAAGFLSRDKYEEARSLVENLP